MIKVIIFDLDQTLLDRTATFRLFLEKQYARFQLELNHIPIDEFVSTIQRYDENGYAPKEAVYAQICNEFGLTIHEKLLADFLENYGQEPVLFEETIAVLETLSKSYPLGLITNGRTKGQNNKIDQAGLRRFFQTIIISEEIGAKKPSPVIFIACLSEMAVRAEEAVYIGDHPYKDVDAAQHVGLKAIWKANPHFPTANQADATINNLDELINIIPVL